MTRIHKSHLLADLLESDDCPHEAMKASAAELRRLHGLLVAANKLALDRLLRIRRLKELLNEGKK